MGKAGILQFGDAGGTTPVALAQITSYTLDTTQDTIEVTQMNATFARDYIAGLHTFSGSADFFLEAQAGAPQYETIDRMDFATDRTVGSIILFPNSTTATHTQISGDIVITGASYTASFDGIVTGSVTFQGTGELTYGVKA